MGRRLLRMIMILIIIGVEYARLDYRTIGGLMVGARRAYRINITTVCLRVIIRPYGETAIEGNSPYAVIVADNGP